MTTLAGLFLIAHGLVHIAVWIPDPKENAPFDPRHSWLLGDAGRFTHVLAVGACVIFVVAGILVLAGADVGAAMAVAGAGISLFLVFLTFNPWLLGAVAIDIAIVILALS